MSVTTIDTARAGIALRASLWIAQVLVFVLFTLVGVMKLSAPIAQLAERMVWAGQYPEAFVRLMGVVDLAGGIGILLPSLTRIKPRLTVAAALGCTALQICAIVFHLSRGEGMMAPLNFVLLALAVFVFWGRSRKAPIAPRA
jgi:uncharacterized membrane protein YphA (DoxX/SURF4 family)